LISGGAAGAGGREWGAGELEHKLEKRWPERKTPRWLNEGACKVKAKLG
jgi:hypothetical protein